MKFKSIFFLIVFFSLSIQAQSQNIIRGPYLQKATPNSIVVKWRTDVATGSAVQFGSTYTNLTINVDDATPKIDHEIEITGLEAATQYFYQITNSSTILEPAAPDLYFQTLPAFDSQPDFSAWIVGDCGTANDNQRAVRDAYYNYYGNNHTDAMIFLGDNAYVDGTDEEYQFGVFEDMYEEKLKNTVAWSTMGNHDGRSASAANQTGPYYDIFTFPTNGESGGLASGTEAYYSYDYGNIHFIVLDSYESDRSVGSAMFDWCLNDIQNTTADWIVALWHHPPYSKGSHNSDTESYMIEMRENFLPMMEFNGLDLVFSGHSHSYERSNLINGHYDTSPNFDVATHTVGATGAGDGNENSDGAYEKDADGDDIGTVYIVAGSSGKISQAPVNHPIMEVNLLELGSCMLNISGDTLSVQFLRETGNIEDHFSIVKQGISSTTPPPCIVEWSDVATIFDNNTCSNAGCHGGNASGLNISTYANFLMGGSQCGSILTDGTNLIDIITTGISCGTNNITPMNSYVPLPVSADDIATLQTWVDSGAPEFCGIPSSYCDNPCYEEYNPNGSGTTDNSLCVTALTCADNPQAICTTTTTCNDNNPCTINETQTIITLTGEVCLSCGNGQVISPSCGDPNATNYNALATCIDNSLCTYSNYCNNPCYAEYNPSSTGTPDNTLCITPLTCADNPSGACLTTAACDDGDTCTQNETQTIITLTGEVCSSCGNGQAITPACGDPNASNYDVFATCIDNSLCIYNNYCNNPCYVEYSPSNVGMPDNTLCIRPLACADNPLAQCIATVVCDDADVCTENETQSTITLTGEVCLSCGNGQAIPPACGDPNATNYNALANCIDNTLCVYSNYCNNPCYAEYDPNGAGMPNDDLCVSPLACADNPNAVCMNIVDCDDNDDCTENEVQTIVTLTGEVCESCGGGNTVEADCGDPNANNYNANAICIDNALCTYDVVTFCDNPCYEEYEPNGNGVSNENDCINALPCATAPESCLAEQSCDDEDECTINEIVVLLIATGEECTSCTGEIIEAVCGDPTATNYVADADCIDNSICTYEDYCNNPCYEEYNPNGNGEADADLCITALTCANAPSACIETQPCDDGNPCTENETETLLISTGETCTSCDDAELLPAGCDDPNASNYDADALCIDNETCIYEEIYCGSPCYLEYEPNGIGLPDLAACFTPLTCADNPLSECQVIQACEGDPCIEGGLEIVMIANGEICTSCFNFTEIDPACGDSAATNYDESATCIDNSLCEYLSDIYCDNPCYEEYNPDGTGVADMAACLTPYSCADLEAYSNNCLTFTSCDDEDPCTLDDFETTLTATGELCDECFSDAILPPQCNDLLAANYNADATCIDNSICEYNYYCKNPCYAEYEPEAIGLNDETLCLTALGCADNPAEECLTIISCEGNPDQNEISVIATNEVCSFCVFTTLNDQDLINVISFFPNPTDEILNIKIENNSFLNKVEVSIINLYGQVLFTEKMNKQLQQLNVADLPVGIYFIKIEMGVSSKIEKLIIE